MTDTLPAPALDARLFRACLARYASGVTVISGLHDGEPVGFTCQSFTSVSLEPPLVAINVMTTSTTYPRLRETGRFAVNVLAHNQRELSDRFARRGDDRWAGVAAGTTERGIPTIADAVLWIDCDIEAEHLAGDHLIVLGRVRALGEPRHDLDPLIFYGSAYRRLAAATA